MPTVSTTIRASSVLTGWMDAWRVIFFIVAGITLLMALWHARFMPEGARAPNTPSDMKGAAAILKDSFVTFFQKQGVWKMVAFAFLFRLSIGFLEKIGPFFMVDAGAKGGLGLSNEQLGIVYATYGLAAVLLGSLLGGWSFHHDDGSGSAEEFRSDPSPASSAAPAP